MVVLMGKLERQLQIEQQAYDYSYNRMINQIAKRVDCGQADELSEGKLILKLTIDKVADKIDEFFKSKIAGQNKLALEVRDMLSFYFDRPKDLAYLVIIAIIQDISKHNQLTVHYMVKGIIDRVIGNTNLSLFRNEATKLDSYIDRVYEKRSRQFRKSKKLRLSKSLGINQPAFLNDVQTRIGTLLLDCVIKSGCNIIKIAPVREKRNKIGYYVSYTEECFRLILHSRETLFTSYKKYPIHIIEPLPWSGFSDSGGYHIKELYKNTLIKKSRSNNTTKELSNLFEKAPDKFGILLDNLNIIQRTKWRINTRVLDVIQSVFYNNIVDYNSPKHYPYLVGNLPYNGDLTIDAFINPYDYGDCNLIGNEILPIDKDKRKQYKKAYDKQFNILKSILGKNIGVRLALDDAITYRDEEEIYFSYQYDFRGRIYPIQQHLHPQGTGYMKALLEFKEGCKITTDEDLFWFKVHGANCYGFDKEEYDVRVQRIEEKVEEILAIAKSPMEHTAYWKDADEPFLYLAWCFEYADFITNPDSFLSHIPIGLDATCSGIQIYSGLLLDGDGASAVNVTGTTRKDIYKMVATTVNGYLEKGDYNKIISYCTSDKERHEISSTPIANEFKGKVTRKLTKRNTMTQPYSVTKNGMYKQLLDELNDMEDTNCKFWTEDNWKVAKFLTDLNDRAIVEVVKGARIGQNFLKEVTADLVKGGRYISYRTPIVGFPVIQKINKFKEQQIRTEIGMLSIYQSTDEIHQIKMVNGIAPNFIHSLDATLLVITMRKLYELGCNSFHFIHDQYGVPINQVVNLNKCVREAYYDLFSKDPLKMWLSQVYKGYPKSSDEIMINTLNLKDVLNSKYIFS